MSNKLTVSCDSWHALRRNTLMGFATIRVGELHMVMRDVAVHTRDGRQWAAPPSKPQVKDGALVKDATGKIQYVPIIEFDGREVRDAFGRAVIAAVLKHEPRAFDADYAEPKRTPVRTTMDDEIAF